MHRGVKQHLTVLGIFSRQIKRRRVFTKCQYLSDGMFEHCKIICLNLWSRSCPASQIWFCVCFIGQVDWKLSKHLGTNILVSICNDLDITFRSVTFDIKVSHVRTFIYIIIPVHLLSNIILDWVWFWMYAFNYSSFAGVIVKFIYLFFIIKGIQEM